MNNICDEPPTYEMVKSESVKPTTDPIVQHTKKDRSGQHPESTSQIERLEIVDLINTDADRTNDATFECEAAIANAEINVTTATLPKNQIQIEAPQSQHITGAVFDCIECREAFDTQDSLTTHWINCEKRPGHFATSPTARHYKRNRSETVEDIRVVHFRNAGDNAATIDIAQAGESLHSNERYLTHPELFTHQVSYCGIHIVYT